MHADLKQQIIAASQTIGIDKIGFTTAAPFTDLKPSLVAQREKGYNSGFEHQNIDERVYPDKIFNQPRSIIAIALAYPTGNIVRQEYLKKLPHVVGRSGCNAFRQNFPFFRFEDDVQKKTPGAIPGLFLFIHF